MIKNNPLTRSKHKQARGHFDALQYQEAKRLYQQICQKDRVDDYAWTMLGITQALLNDLDEAENSLQKAANLNPRGFDAIYNLGRTQYGKGLFDQAIDSYQKALCLQPDHVDTLVGLGLSAAGRGQWIQAQQFYERILRINPRHAAALDNLANVMRSQGLPELAIPFYRQAYAINPRAATYSNLLLSLHYPATHDPLAAFLEHQAWGESLTKSFLAPRFPQTDRNPDRKLRIGYVTPDLRSHSVAYFIESLLVNHDRSQYEIFCYLELGAADDMTRRLLEFAGTVRNTGGVMDDKVAAMVREDQIDVLIDLAGHTNNNRLPVFARKPAPIQITYLGYPNTTGLPMMDYRFTDEWADPPGMTEHLHTEKLLRIDKGFLCFTPPAESPEIPSPPAIEHGYVTFGSFNALPKITAEMLEIWSKILLSTPDSHLLIKNAQLTDPVLQERLRNQLVQLGVGGERIEIMGRTSKAEHMSALGCVDIALDTFPYHGTTTTCDTLWMGVPVITLAGKSHVSRVGVSLLSRMGLDEHIAHSAEEYIEKAARLANSGDELSMLRRNMRARFKGAGVCDGVSFTRTVEQLYRLRWQEWCEEAIENPREVPPVKADEVEIHLKSAWVSQSKQQWDAAIDAFQKALELAPDNTKALYGLGAAFAEKGLHELAIKYFQQYLEIVPDNKQVEFHIARLTGASPSAPPAEYVSKLFDQYAEHFDLHLITALSYKAPELLYAAIGEVGGTDTVWTDVLDLGCGTGLCALLFKERALKLSGVDLSEKMIEVAKRRNLYDRLTVGDITVVLEGLNQVHDLIIAADVFVYVGELKRVFELSSAALKRSGLFAFTVEAAKDEAVDYVLQPTGRYAHSKHYIKELAESFGLEMSIMNDVVLRIDRGNPINGYMVVLRRPC
ncbi:MAG: tetratricopeptide repeat protein [Thiobacillus sp.]